MPSSSTFVARRGLGTGSTAGLAVSITALGAFLIFVFWRYVLPTLRVTIRRSGTRNEHNLDAGRATGPLTRSPPYPMTNLVSALAQSVRFEGPGESLPFYNPRTESPFFGSRYTEHQTRGDNSCPRSTSTKEPNPPPRISNASSLYSRVTDEEDLRLQLHRPRPSSATSAGTAGQSPIQLENSCIDNDTRQSRLVQTMPSQDRLLSPAEKQVLFERMELLGFKESPTARSTPISAEMRTPNYRDTAALGAPCDTSIGRPDSPVLGALAYMKSAKSSVTGASDEYWRHFDSVHLQHGRRPAGAEEDVGAYQHPRAVWRKQVRGEVLEPSNESKATGVPGIDSAPQSLVPRPLAIRKTSSMRSEGEAALIDTRASRLCPAPNFWHHKRSRSVTSMTTVYTNHENKSDNSLSLPLQSPTPAPRLSFALDEPSVASNFTRLSRADFGLGTTEVDNDAAFQSTDISDDLFGDRMKRLKRVDTIAGPSRVGGVKAEEIVGRGGRVVRHGGWI